jgi:TRAP-type uncharacterized transport system substrate-binding protein
MAREAGAPKKRFDKDALAALLRRRARARVSNRRQRWLYAALTLLVVALGVGGARFVMRPGQLTFAVGPAGSVEHRFAQRLANAVQQSSWRLRVKIDVEETQSAALARLQSGKADLVIGRTDAVLPQKARALAIIETATLVIAAPKAAKIDGVPGLKGKHVAVLAAEPRDMALMRAFFAAYDTPVELFDQTAETAGAVLERKRSGAIAAIVRRSTLTRQGAWERLAQKPGYQLLKLEGAKGLERRVTGVRSESLEAGVLSAQPRQPDEDLDTIAVQELLLTRAKMPTGVAAELAQIIIENREALAEPGVYAANIEAPDTDKDTRPLAHAGAADYVNGEVKTFLERYSDLFYVALSLGSVVGSIFVGLYTTLTRVKPVRASDLVLNLRAAVEKGLTAENADGIDEAEGEIDRIVDHFVVGLQDGSVSSEGVDVFRLALDQARGALGRRRGKLAAPV